MPRNAAAFLRAPRIRAVGALGLCLLAAATAGCGDNCCISDGRPIGLVTGPGGELMVRVATEGGPALAVVDPGNPITLWNGPGPARVGRRDLRLLGEAPPGQPAPLRAFLRDSQVIEAPLQTVGEGVSTITPAAILGADVMSLFSVEIGFQARELVLWRRQSANDAFLATAGYAVLRLPRRGGGRIEVVTKDDWIGRDNPLEVAPSRLLMRACAEPGKFDFDPERKEKCCPNELQTKGPGADLTLLLSTSTGPLVLGRAAWNRVAAKLGHTPNMEEKPLVTVLAASPVPALWTSISRLALIDREVDPALDPGPCAELGRARRTERVAVSQSRNSVEALCAEPCDRASRESTLAENSAAYIEFDGSIQVAVIDDATPFLQGLRAEVRPQAAEVDGLIGARALSRARVELDYISGDTRAIFSCEPPPTSVETPSPTAPAGGVSAGLNCRAVGRCPRLPDGEQRHLCFGLPAHGLPISCNNADSSCPE